MAASRITVAQIEGDLTVTEPAALLGVSTATLTRRIRLGTAPPSYTVAGRLRRFVKADVERWREQQRNGSAK